MSRARCGAGAQSQHHSRTVEGGHVDVAAERGLGEGDGHPDREVVAVATEQMVRGNVAFDDQVARWAAVAAGCTATLEADLLTVGNTRRNSGLHFAAASLGAGAMTRGAGIGDDHASSPAD